MCVCVCVCVCVCACARARERERENYTIFLINSFFFKDHKIYLDIFYDFLPSFQKLQMLGFKPVSKLPKLLFLEHSTDTNDFLRMKLTFRRYIYIYIYIYIYWGCGDIRIMKMLFIL